MQGLRDEAMRWGIEPSYFDVRGTRHEASEDILRYVCDALACAGPPQPFPDMPDRPVVAHQGSGERMWLLAVQLYGVRSRRNWGHGDFGDLKALIGIVAEAGGAGIGLNPLHALLYDRPGTGSPYSPSSRLFINPLYIDVEAAPGFASDQAADLEGEIARLRDADFVDYLAVANLKLSVLRRACCAFRQSADVGLQREFEAFRRERGWKLARFAAFETLRAIHPSDWTNWPDEWRNPDRGAVERLRTDHPDMFALHEYLQWVADRQLADCSALVRQLGMRVGLYLDTAIGVTGDGADAWIAQSTMLQGLSVGAPPDVYNPAGQNWGLTAYNPHGLIAEDMAPFRQMLRAAMRHAGAIRLDHVLGLMRLFVIPHGRGARDGVYLRYPLAAMLAVVAEESRRWRCIVIGEDLGTVPEGFRETMARWGLWSYLVMLFERNSDGSFRRPETYPAMAIATVNTHDLATFSGWLKGRDLRLKHGLSIDPGESAEERRCTIEALRAAVGSDCSFAAVVGFLAAAPARLLSIAIEDVLEVDDQVNIPGTVDQYPNWRRRWPVSLEQLATDARFQRIAAVLVRAERAGSGS